MSSLAPPQETEDLSSRLDEFRSSLAGYSRDCLKIKTKQAELIPFEFNNAQRIVHQKLSAQLAEKGYIKALILKARQEGISTYVAARFTRRSTLYANQRAFVIADQKSRGSTIFGIYETFERNFPLSMKPTRKHGRAGLLMNWDTKEGTGLDSNVIVQTAKDAAVGRGATLQMVHASEMAFWENPEEVWVALMQAVPDVGAEVIVESTANGVGNMFHVMWQEAESGESDFIAIFLPWFIHEEYAIHVDEQEQNRIVQTLDPWEQRAFDEGIEYEGNMVRLSVEQLQWRRNTIKNKLANDERLFRQEYPSTALEAFLVAGNSYFDEEVILDYLEKAIKPKRFRIIRPPGESVLRMPDVKGQLRIWEKPREQGNYVMFCDTATGRKTSKREDSIYAQDRERGGRDFSCAWVLDVDTQTFVAKLHGRIPPERFARDVYDLSYMYSSQSRRSKSGRWPALVGVERNHSSGETVVKTLKAMKHPNLYLDRTLNRRLEKRTEAVGWITTEAKRMVMLDEFSAGMRSAEIVMPDAETLSECLTFIRGDSGKPEAQEGCHDDRVIAGAGAWAIAKAYHRPSTRRSAPGPKRPARTPQGLMDYGWNEGRAG